MSDDLARQIISSLVNELVALLDGETCDHSVGICWCSMEDTLQVATMYLDGIQWCPTCNGDTFIWHEDGSYDGVQEVCPTCHGRGTMPL